MRSQLHHFVADAARRWADAPAVTYKDATLTYSELWRDVQEVGSGLQRLGLERGERVGVYLDKRLETVTAVFGCSAAAGVIVPINPVLRQKQVAYIVENCSCRMLITTPERLDALREELASCSSLSHVIVLGNASARPGDPYTVLTWEALLQGVSADALGDRGVVDCDMTALLYTSGSTGKPKGVVVSHCNLIVGGESVSSYLENTHSDVLLAALPLSFDAGFSQLTTGFNVGAQVVLVNYLLPDDVIRQCAAHGVQASPRSHPCGSSSPRRPGPRAALGACGTSPTPAAACPRRRSTSSEQSSRARSRI